MTKSLRDETIEYTTIDKYTTGFAQYIYDNLNL